MIRYKRQTIDGIGIFYREAGAADKRAILLLHGFPTSSHMYRNLIPQLAQNYHVVDPDYPGFGHSDTSRRDEFNGTFDTYAGLVGRQLARIGVD